MAEITVKLFSDFLESGSNGCRIPREEMEKAVERFKKEKDLNRWVTVGQPKHRLAIDIHNVVGRIEDMSWDGADLFAKVSLYPTDMGKVIEALSYTKAQIGFFPIGTAVVNASGSLEEVTIRGIDLVL